MGDSFCLLPGRGNSIRFLSIWVLIFSSLLACVKAGECRLPGAEDAIHGIDTGERTWIEIAGAVYGAMPDERGPIGGGEGYEDIVTSGDYTVKDLDSLVTALSEAGAGEIVFIPGETEIDLTTRVYIEKLVLEVPGGVTLAGERGHNGSRGALLKSDAQNTYQMLRIAGDNVRITGIRVQGPNPERRIGHHRRAFGPGGGGYEYYYKFPAQAGIVIAYGGPHHNKLRVDNCEISGFGHAGVSLAYGEGHSINHNFIHHCQMQGLGYGVCLDYASALIEYNLFDWNRHSIAGTGNPGCSYVARHNIQLDTSLSHDFDMHEAPVGGIAGASVEIYNNTFLSGEMPVRIFGAPEKKGRVYRNWFVRRSDPAAAVLAGANTSVFDNIYGRDPATPK